MHNFRAVCFLAVLVCLVVCVSATPELNAEGAARAAVGQAKQSVTEVRERAQSELDKANDLLRRVELSKNQAAQALSKAAKTAKGNTEAEKIAQQIKSLSDAVDTSYSDAQGKLSTALNTLTSFVEEAQGLVKAPEIEIKAKEDSPEDYTETNEKATGLKSKADNLNLRITAAVTAVDGVDSTTNEMEKNAKEAQLKDAHVSVIVSVAKISKMLGNADTTIGQIEGKKNEVSGIVGEMQKDCTTELTQSNEVIKKQCQIANDALTDATGAVKKAEKAKTDMTEQKKKADAALLLVETATGVETAQKEVDITNECVNQVNQFAAIINNALQTAKDSVTNANDAKQKLQTALLTATSATHTEQGLTHSQVKALQGNVSAAVTKIQTMMGEADRILQKTENHKKAVHDIFQEMQSLKTTAKMESIDDINKLCRTAEGELTKATGAVEKVKTEKEAMRQEKVIADAALKDVNAATENDKAQQQADTATSCLAKVKENIVQVRSALQTAESSVTKTNDLMQKLKTILSTTTTVPRTKEVKEAEKADPPVGDSTEPDQKETTPQATITKTEQQVSKDLLDQSDNSADKLKDALSNGAQNVPITALTGGKAPAPGAKNDSAMTVSVPLLVALIASAVLQ